MESWSHLLGSAAEDSRPSCALGTSAHAGQHKVMLLAVGLGVGGTEGQLLEIATHLSRERFVVTVCALRGAGIIVHEMRERGIRVLTLKGKGAWDFRVLYRLFLAIRAERPDLIHSFLSLANLACCLVGRLLRVPILILSYRDVEVWKRWYHLMVDRAMVRWAHVITCSSEAVRQFAVAKFGGESQKYVTIHNGIDPKRFTCQPALDKSELGLQEGVTVIGTVCRLEEPKKGLSVLLKALAILKTQRSALPLCQLLIVGEGPAFQSLQRLSVRLGVSDLVTFAGMRRDIERILSSLDVFVLPSLYEGFGIAIIEAMAASRPVVATAVGGITEIVIHGETGLLVPPGDARSLAEAIHALLADPYKAQLFGAKGRARVLKMFTIEAMLRKHEELYEALLKSRTGVMEPRKEVLV